nr:hypothetical protein [Phenylobacterium sp. J367]
MNFIPAGQSGLNLGWRFMEGSQPYSGQAPAGLTAPVLDYDHTTPLYSGVAVTGGYVYHGPGGGNGLYWFGDFSRGHVWSVSVRDGQAQDFLNRNAQIVVHGGGDIDQIASFAVDGQGAALHRGPRRRHPPADPAGLGRRRLGLHPRRGGRRRDLRRPRLRRPARQPGPGHRPRRPGRRLGGRRPGK